MVLKKEYLKTSLDMCSPLIYKHISGLLESDMTVRAFRRQIGMSEKHSSSKVKQTTHFSPDADVLSILWAR